MAILKTIVIVIVAIIILILIYNYFKKSPEKYIKKAIKAHKKGEKYHNLADAELAEDYYEEAEIYRKKAEELENLI